MSLIFGSHEIRDFKKSGLDYGSILLLHLLREVIDGLRLQPDPVKLNFSRVFTNIERDEQRVVGSLDRQGHRRLRERTLLF